MAQIIPFPTLQAPQPEHFREELVIGEETGITVRVLARIGWPHELIVALDGTFEGMSTIATLPASERAVAEAIAHATLAALEAAEITWSLRKGVGRL